MIGQFTIKEKSATLITLNRQGDNVQLFVSAHKHTMKFIQLREKNIGDVVQVDYQISPKDSSRIFCAESMQLAESLDAAENLLHKQQKRSFERSMWAKALEL
jgi:hypothetical protein